MEGTSGAADLELLRGGSGEAALGPRRPRASRPRDHVGPKLSRLRGSQGARGVIVGGVPCPSLRTRSGCGSRRHAAPDSPSGAPRSCDRRCPSGSGWGEALVEGRRRKAEAPADRASRTHAPPDARRRVAKAGRPLARETSAGGARRAFWSLGSRWRASGSQGLDRRRATITRIRWSTWRMASTPSGGLLPVQRKLGAPRRRAWSGDRSILWLCSWIEAGCRSRRASPGPSQPPRRATVVGSVGSSLPAPCSRTLRTRKGDGSRLPAAKPGVRWRAVDDPAPPLTRCGCASSSSGEGRGESTRRGKAPWRRRSGRL